MDGSSGRGFLRRVPPFPPQDKLIAANLSVEMEIQSFL